MYVYTTYANTLEANERTVLHQNTSTPSFSFLVAIVGKLSLSLLQCLYQKAKTTQSVAQQ